MKKFICIISVFCLLLVVAGCGSKPADNSNGAETPADQTNGEPEIAVITVKDFGTIEVQLDRSAAPETVENFVNLVNDGFYNGLTFHRIISGFMIQGGDPLGNGTGGSDTTIKGEFSQNGIDNPIKHARGTISMARAADPDSASSQFFIVHKDSSFLDGAYAAFGHVTEGMDVVDAICEKVSVDDGNGSVSPENQPIIESIVMK